MFGSYYFPTNKITSDASIEVCSGMDIVWGIVTSFIDLNSIIKQINATCSTICESVCLIFTSVMGR